MNNINVKSKHQKADEAWKPFILNISVIILIFILGIFISLFVRNKHLIEAEIITRAKSYFQNIVFTRRWNADYGGVFVEKNEGTQSCPYLENPDIQAVDGKLYTKKNPALMTREISQYAEKEGIFLFHITSLKPLNPGNVPDKFEKESLSLFEKGIKEFSKKENENSITYFRYMAPLVTENSCLQCHRKQGYNIGDIRGGISIKFNITEIEKNLKANTFIIFALGGLTIIILLGVIYLFIFQLMKKLSEARKKIKEMAIMDELTKIYNRRYFFIKVQEEFQRAKRYGKPLCCIMIDVDYFKRINDTYGHSLGDMVLEQLAGILKSNCRAPDTVARYGGEEFIILLPEADREGSVATAEKIRILVEQAGISTEAGTPIPITISLGAAHFSPAHLKKGNDYQQLIKAADAALYLAKLNGRNRVETFES